MKEKNYFEKYNQYEKNFYKDKYNTSKGLESFGLDPSSQKTLEEVLASNNIEFPNISKNENFTKIDFEHSIGRNRHCFGLGSQNADRQQDLNRKNNQN